MDEGLRGKFYSFLLSYSAAKVPAEKREALIRVTSAIASVSMFRHGPGAPVDLLQQHESQLRAERWRLQLALERKYGDGRFEERRAHLDTILRDLERRPVKLSVVYSVLDEARRAQFRETLVWRHIDQRRERTKNEAIAFRHLHKWVTKLKPFFLDEPDFPSPEDRLDWHRTLSALETLEAFSAAALAEPGTSEKLRRSRRGRPRAEWVHDARRQLREAGVAKEDDREDLLGLAGLVARRPS